MKDIEKAVPCEEFQPPADNVPQDVIDRFWNDNTIRNYIKLLKERRNIPYDDMAKQSYTPEGTAKNFHNGRSKNPRIAAYAQYIYLNGGSLDEMYYPEGNDARIAEATKALKEMYESQSALQAETFEKQIADIKEVNEKAMADLVESHKNELAELNESHKQQLLELNACHRQEITDLVSHHNEKAELDRGYNKEILNAVIFDKKWFRILSVILGISNVLLLITLAVILK